MSNTAAHLMDHIIPPDVTLRQWVLTVPFELRLLLAAKPEALSAVGRILIQEIQRWQQQRARALGFEQAEGAAVSFCQRFGSSLNLNCYRRMRFVDVIEDVGRARSELRRRNLPADPPPLARARAPDGDN